MFKAGGRSLPFFLLHILETRTCLMPQVEKVTQLESHHVLGYFENMRSAFFLKMGVLAQFHIGNIEQHRVLSKAAAEMATELGDEHCARFLSSINEEIVENLKEDTVGSLIVSAWTVFELIIKDVVTPDYANSPRLLQADYKRKIFGFTAREKKELDLFYHIRNAALHYNGAYHAYRKVDIHYEGQHFLSDGHIGEKIIVSPKVALKIVEDLQRYTMQAWSKCAQPAGRI
jgi:hypothetical protein